MNKTDHLILLVNSMSKAEKRFLQLNIKMYSPNKDYQVLYRLLQPSNTNAETIKKEFRKQLPNANFDVCSHHLYKLITRNLIIFEGEKDPENLLLRNLQECKLLFSRGIHPACFKLLEKSKKLSLEHEKFSIFCLFVRLELQLLNQLEFKGLSEDDLVKKQSKMESVSRQQRAIDNHYSLYNLIRHRQFHQGPTRTEHEKEKLNDLAFNELQANVGQVKDSFEARKIHLLFQSSYFMMTANPRSSLKIYYELNELFEQNKKFWTSPPVYYLIHLYGILHNLRIFQQFDAMPYFLERAKEVARTDSSAGSLVNYLVFLFESYSLTDQAKYADALIHLNNSKEILQESQSILSVISDSELALQIALILYKNRQLREAMGELRRIINLGKSMQHAVTYPSMRLFLIMIHFDLKDFEFLTYEIRSFERELKNLSGSKMSEQLVLGSIKKLLFLNDQAKANQLLEDCILQLEEMMKNPNENLRIKSLDLIGWLKSKL
jgi:hypothetical protein